jgi:hypothetical protein
MQPRLIEVEQSEAEIQKNIVEILKLKNYIVIRLNSGMRMIGKRVVRFYQIMNNGAISGFPDLFAIKNNKILMIEVKSKKGKLRESQEDFRKLAEKHGNSILVASSWQEVLKYVENAT